MQRFYSVPKLTIKPLNYVHGLNLFLTFFHFFAKIIQQIIYPISVIVVHGIGEKTSLIIAKRNNNGLEIKAGNGRSIIFFCIV